MVRTWLPACWSQPVRVGRNEARQLLFESEDVDIRAGPRQGELTAIASHGPYRVKRSASGLGDHERALRISREDLVDPTRLQDVEGLRWMGSPQADDPAAVLESFDEAFVFREELSGGQGGLRRPQIGAVHAVLGYWTTNPTQPATVVMPTGTGKTETMVALLVAARLPRLLVVVPSNALRDQIATKFETLGVLQRSGVVADHARRPVVGRIRHGLGTAEDARRLAEACNVLVTTPEALLASAPEAIAAMTDVCSHLFIDEAHHVAALTWRRIRDLFADRRVLQFTATPFREDGRRLGGRILYQFPLREAQAQNYFARIDYTSVRDFGDPDTAIAARAVQRLRDDLATGYDHLLMARVSRVGRAREVRELYAEIAPDFEPVVLHSTLPAGEQRDALADVREGRSRIVVCVNMLGEGFDLPTLKVAAVHDPHRSLGVTLQFLGRFARVSDETIGGASVFLTRPESGYDPSLRKLYAEDADWNELVRDLSEGAIGEQQDVDDFEAAFGSLPEEVPIRTLAPKMSTVVFRTRCQDWNPQRALSVFGVERMLTDPIAVNEERHVAWFVIEQRASVVWAELENVEEVTYELYVLYWDSDRRLLYVNSSNTDSLHEDLALAVTAETADLVKGEDVYRVMANVERLVPTNVGVLDVRDRSRRFSLHVGADVIEGFPQSEAQTKAKTNIFAHGFEDGERVSIGGSLKGRVWSHRVARTLKHWVDWCDDIGTKLTDTSISIDGVMRGFIRPQLLDARPELVPLTLELWSPLLSTSEELRVVHANGSSCPLVDMDLRITEHSTSGTIPIEARCESFAARYELDMHDGKMSYRPVDAELSVVSRRAGARTLSDYLNHAEPLLLLEQDAIVRPPGLLLKPDRELQPFDADRLQAIDWSDIDFRKESQGPDRDATSIQARAVEHVLAHADWELVIDDDGPGEIADIVAIREEGDRLVVWLIHCKFSSSAQPGSRVADFYEVCGQAQKSVRWRHHHSLLFSHLVRRERNRNQKELTGLLQGDSETIFSLEERALTLRPDFTMILVQPGLSKARVSPPVLQLLASTELYVRETAKASFEVVCSA